MVAQPMLVKQAPGDHELKSDLTSAPNLTEVGPDGMSELGRPVRLESEPTKRSTA